MLEQTNGLRTQRPQLDSYVPCNDAVDREIRKWLEGVANKSVSRCLLVSGPSGLGKTTLAMTIADHLGVKERDFQQVNCADLRTLDDARTLIDSSLSYGPSLSPYRILVLDECHQLVENAQQAFLTPFENLAPNIIVICCTSNPEQLKPQFKGRMYQIALQPYPPERIVEILSNLPGEHDPELLVSIAEASEGVPRTAIDMLEKGATVESSEEAKKKNVLFSQTLMLLAQANPEAVLLCESVEFNQVTTFVRKVSEAVLLGWYYQKHLKPHAPEHLKKVAQEFSTKVALVELYTGLQYCPGKYPEHMRAVLMRYVEANLAKTV